MPKKMALEKLSELLNGTETFVIVMERDQVSRSGYQVVRLREMTEEEVRTFFNGVGRPDTDVDAMFRSARQLFAARAPID